MAMDVKRDPAILKKKKRRQAVLLGLAAMAVIAISVAVSRLEPAAPSVPSTSVWFGTVKRGAMVREIRGAGTLVPEEIRWITARTSGRVERIILRAGAPVQPGTPILELSNPELRQQVMSAELDLKTAQANLTNQRAAVQTQRMREEFAVSDAESALAVAVSDLEANKTLAAQGLVAELTIKVKQAAVDQAKNRRDLAQKQLAMAKETESLQLAPLEAQVNQQRGRYDQLLSQMADLVVKADMSGQLQVVSVEVGQSVGSGSNLVRVSDPTRLKAEVRISETQTRDLAIGQIAKIDTRNGIVKGHVTRIDPASQGGTVGVDVSLDEPLPTGARPDQSVDGVIELQRLEDILYVESPTFGQEDQTIQLFKDMGNGEAVRVQVKLGVRSVQFVEVKGGLQVGDRVVLSDMSAYDAYDRVRLN